MPESGVSLEKRLEKAEKATSRWRRLTWVFGVVVLALLGGIYQVTVLDYAELENVSIDLVDATGNRVRFSYDVVTAGRLDAQYGPDAVLSDDKEVQAGNRFTWSWTARGEVTVSLRYRDGLFPARTERTFEIK